MVGKGIKPTSYSRVACIGSGISAIAVGATLKRWYGFGDVRFFERHDNLGGTWFINQYPGCACDVPSLLYSYSFEPNSSWTHTLANKDELWAYLKGVADKYDLSSKMTFRATVQRCEWIEESSRWWVHVLDGRTGDVFVHECQFLFGGAGQLTEPRSPEEPGLHKFGGAVIHACRWPADADLAGKNVAVIGNGCTGTQLVPAIAGRTKHLTQFVRSKHWVLPPFEIPHLETVEFLCKWIPGFLFLLRLAAFLLCENNIRGLYMTEPGAAYRAGRRNTAETYMRKTAPGKYLDMLIPDYEFGCKRRIFDSGYLEALHRPNVTLTNDPIVEFVEDGIRTGSGVTKADVIVLANGYATNTFLPGVTLVGRGGVTADKHWASLGGPGAYNTTSMSGFPNLFVILGPNTGSGHTSAFMAVENAVNFALRIMKPVLDGRADAVDVKYEAEQAYVKDIQDKSSETVFFSGCNSWYTQTKDGAKPRNAMVYPYSQGHFWYTCLLPKFQDFDYTTRKTSLGVK